MPTAAETELLNALIDESGFKNLGLIFTFNESQGRGQGREIDLVVEQENGEGTLEIQLKASQLWLQSNEVKRATFKRNDGYPLYDYNVRFLLLATQDAEHGAWRMYLLDLLSVGGLYAQEHVEAGHYVDQHLRSLLSKSTVQRVIRSFRTQFAAYETTAPAEAMSEALRAQEQ